MKLWTWPRNGDIEILTRFAWWPTTMNNGDFIWWEPFFERQRYCVYHDDCAWIIERRWREE